jgi:hypothetical protein
VWSFDINNCFLLCSFFSCSFSTLRNISSNRGSITDKALWNWYIPCCTLTNGYGHYKIRQSFLKGCVIISGIGKPQTTCNVRGILSFSIGRKLAALKKAAHSRNNLLKNDTNGDFYEVSTENPAGQRTYLGEQLGIGNAKKFKLAAPGMNYNPDPEIYAMDDTLKN